jgi:DNA-directed RNA polymerase specialized sigma24 family protein
MHCRRHFRLASLLVLLAFLLFVLRADFLTLNFLALVFATLLSSLPPKDLFERCAELPIDRAAWKDFFARYNQDIEATVRRIIGYPGQGRYAYLFDDVMSRFYQRLLENDRRALHALRGVEEGQARAYLRTIVAGVVYKMIGSEPSSNVPLDTAEAEGGENVRPNNIAALRDREYWSEEALALSASLHAELERILRGGNKYRNMLIFKLVILDGFSPREIAQFGCFRVESGHAVEQLVSRTRQKLRDEFRK